MTNKNPPPGLKNYQEALANNIFSQTITAVPEGMQASDVQRYNDLAFDNLNGILHSAFPQSASVLSTQKWHKLLKDFLASNTLTTPLFTEIPQHFMAFITEHKAQYGRPGYLWSLLHFEWMQSVLAFQKDKNPKTIKREDAFDIQSKALLNQNHYLLAYDYPVYQFFSNPQAKCLKQTCYILLYKDKYGHIHTLVLDMLAARLVQALKEYSGTMAEAIDCVLEESSEHSLQNHKNAQQLLHDWRQKGFILTSFS